MQSLFKRFSNTWILDKRTRRLESVL